MGKTKRQNTLADTSVKGIIQKLKSVCRNQQKELARLRKELDRRNDVSDDYRDLLNSKDEDKIEESLDRKCPECNKDVKVSPIGKFNLVVCTNCKWRMREMAV